MALTNTARLVDAGEIDERERGVTTTLPRAEVEEALRSENGAPELVLDIARARDGDAERPDVETHQLRVAWDRDDLERVLQTTSGERVVLSFDRDELEQAVEEDVEAHGLREKAAIISVVAMVGAGAGAGAAAAMPLSPGSSGPQAAATAPSDFGGAAPATVTGAAVPSAESTGLVGGQESPATVTGAAVSSSEEGTGLVGGQQAPATVTGAAVSSSEEGTGLVGGQQAPATVTGAAVSSSEGTGLVGGRQSPAEVTGVAQPSGADLGAREAGMPRAMPADYAAAGVGDQAVPASESGGGPSLSAGEAAAIGAGLAGLAITAAGFAVRGGRRRVEPA